MFGFITKPIQNLITFLILLFLFIGAYKFATEYLTFKKIVQNLKAESRVAEVLVVQSTVDEYDRTYTTTIKFLEYDVNAKPLKAKYFTFKGNLIQFQTLVVRFDDKYIEQGHRMKGKSICLFLKAFVLNGAKTQEFVITPVKEIMPKKSDSNIPFYQYSVPEGYRVGNPPNYFERHVWENFWKYALDETKRNKMGIKNAQIEAPGQVFVPGTIYTLMLEHDGGLRIDTRPIPQILKNEKVPA